MLNFLVLDGSQASVLAAIDPVTCDRSRGYVCLLARFSSIVVRAILPKTFH